MKNKLIEKAYIAAESAYAPYSNFKVGAALLSTGGKIYTGANIENSSYGATVCAERVALFSAVHEGEREFSALAVTAVPCGICLQTLSEFCKSDMKIYCTGETGTEEYTLGDLLPQSFSLEKTDENI